MLVGIGISDTGVDVQRINPNLHELLWTKFQRLRALWQSRHDVNMADVPSPLRPPPSAARWPDEALVPLDLGSAGAAA